MGKCRLCPADPMHGCAVYTANPDSGKCYCDHDEASHAAKVFEPRGQCGACPQFRNANGSDIITDFNARCGCGAPYRAHERLQTPVPVSSQPAPPPPSQYGTQANNAPVQNIFGPGAVPLVTQPAPQTMFGPGAAPPAPPPVLNVQPYRARNILEYAPAAGASTQQRPAAEAGPSQLRMPEVTGWPSLGPVTQLNIPQPSGSRASRPRSRNTTSRVDPNSGGIQTFYTDSTRGSLVQRNVCDIFIGCLPIDISPDAQPVCPNLFGDELPEDLFRVMGSQEAFDSRMDVLEQVGHGKLVTFSVKKKSESILPQLMHHYTSLFGGFTGVYQLQFKTVPKVDLGLKHDQEDEQGPNRLKNAHANMPFRVLKVRGPTTHCNKIHLAVDRTWNEHKFIYKNLESAFKGINRVRRFDSTKNTYVDMLLLCPRFGSMHIGTIQQKYRPQCIERPLDLHLCLPRFILGMMQASDISIQGHIPKEERMAAMAKIISKKRYQCLTDRPCIQSGTPGSTTYSVPDLPKDEDQNSQSSDDYYTGAEAAAGSSATRLTPLMINLRRIDDGEDTLSTPGTGEPQDVASPALSAQGSLFGDAVPADLALDDERNIPPPPQEPEVEPAAPFEPFVQPPPPAVMDVSLNEYEFGGDPTFRSMTYLQLEVEDVDERILEIRGNSTDDLSDKIWEALKSAKGSDQTVMQGGWLLKQGVAGVTPPREIKLCEYFPVAMKSWYAGADRGSSGNGTELRDNSGDGVMRAALSGAIQKRFGDGQGEGPTEDLLVDLGNQDGYPLLSLKLMPNLFNAAERRLHKFFALGALCLLHLFTAQSIPERISPSLILLALSNDAESIMDPKWIAHAEPHAWKELQKIPDDDATPIPDDKQLWRLIQSAYNDGINAEMKEALQNNPRDYVVRDIRFRALIGCDNQTFLASPEFKAFQAGFNVRLGETKQSLGQMIDVPTAKYLLASSIGRYILSPHQLLKKLKYKFAISGEGKQKVGWDGDKHKALLIKGVKRYFFGKGHPYSKDRALGFVSPENLQREENNALLRSHLFMETLSGVRCLPRLGDKFLINFTDEIPETFSTNLKYDLENDLLPCFPRTCFLIANVFVNKRLVDVLNAAGGVDIALGTDTEFDWLMHMGLMEAGGMKDDFNAPFMDINMDGDIEIF